MVVMGVFRTVCIAWYSLSECACVWERDPKYWQAWLLFGRWDYIWLLFIPLYFSVSSEFFCYWVYITFIIRKKRKVFFPRRKANRAPAKCEDAAENSGWTRTGHRPSEVDGVFEWRGDSVVCTNVILGHSWVEFPLMVMESLTRDVLGLWQRCSSHRDLLLEWVIFPLHFFPLNTFLKSEVSVSRSVKSYSHLQLTDCLPARLLCSWNSPGKNTGRGRHSLP